jgi:hypothetical protein
MSKPVSFSYALAALLSVMTGLQSFAQSVSPPGTVPTALTCRDFHQNPDGTWSPNRPITVGDITLSPSVNYKKGQVFAGLPLVEALESSCIKATK